MVIHFTVGKCHLGAVLVAKSQKGICAVSLGDKQQDLVCDLQQNFPKATLVVGDEHFQKSAKEIICAIENPPFLLNLPLDIEGTLFQRLVWRALQQIPCGETRSYSEIAQAIGTPKGTRAVASACAANRIAIIVPCHRVIRSDGKLSGYRWGVERKIKLLLQEQNAPSSR